jgi:hypothetical protein
MLVCHIDDLAIAAPCAQSITALSTVEAEHSALSMSMRGLLPLKLLAKEMNDKLGLVLPVHQVLHPVPGYFFECMLDDLEFIC